MKTSFAAKVQMRVPLVGLRPIAAARHAFTRKASNALWFKSGRIALYWALRSVAGASDTGTVLLPAYHCDSMVEACIWSGLRPRFYAVKEDLAPDPESLSIALDGRARAVVLVHYFGFPTISESAVELCRSAGVPVVEDAAHINLIDRPWPHFVGQIGRWVIGSPRKFYPVYDGGCAYYSEGALRPIERPRPASVGDEIRSASFLLSQLRLQMRRNKELRSNASIEEQDLLARPNAPTRVEAPRVSQSYADRRFELTSQDAMTRLSTVIIGGSDRVGRAERRRRNYRLISDRLRGASRGRPLFPGLQDDSAVPYVFACRLSHPDVDHSRLRALGIEILRWENLHTTICDNSNEFADRLIQIPCHEGLTSGQLTYLLDCLRRVLG